MGMKITCGQQIQLLAQMSDDFLTFNSKGQYQYHLVGTDGATAKAASQRLHHLHSSLMMKTASVKSFEGLTKIAFDTRKFSQDEVRNPRSNLQYWQRSAEWITADLQVRINRLSRLIPYLQEIKTAHHLDPAWHNSFVRKLGEDMERILRIKEGDNEILEPQVAYLEQLLDARYRLSLDQLDKISDQQFKTAILLKDEELSKRGVHLDDQKKDASLTKTTDSNQLGSNIVNAIFGNQALRLNGEKSVTRTITITITDTAND